jgi:hypothetical protein
MVLPCGILGGFFSSPRRNNCTPPAEQGTARNATEAGNNRFSARGGGRRRRQYRAAVGCVRREIVVEPRSIGGFDVSAADRGNRIRFNLRLPTHRQTTKAPGVFNRATCDAAGYLDFHFYFDSNFPNQPA